VSLLQETWKYKDSNLNSFLQCRMISPLKSPITCQLRRVPTSCFTHELYRRETWYASGTTVSHSLRRITSWRKNEIGDIFIMGNFITTRLFLREEDSSWGSIFVWHWREIPLACEIREKIDGMMDANKLFGVDVSCTETSVLRLDILQHQQANHPQESRAVGARKPRDAAAVLFGLKFADKIYYKFNKLTVAKLRKPGFRATNIPTQNRI